MSAFKWGNQRKLSVLRKCESLQLAARGYRQAYEKLQVFESASQTIYSSV
jgi:hypothetical protein